MKHLNTIPIRNYFRISIIFCLLTLCINSVWGDGGGMHLIGDALGNWTSNQTRYTINNYYGQDSKYCYYVWMETGQYFALYSNDNQYGPTTANSEIKDGTGAGTGAYNTNSWK
ncbi:MAG: hypothetical protein IJS05_03865, partial [Paludibacteraceae bacterium]|nr:hypothetical protein [Paludibacteraceae bacterium]